eukprot:408097_1
MTSSSSNPSSFYPTTINTNSSVLPHSILGSVPDSLGTIPSLPNTNSTYSVPQSATYPPIQNIDPQSWQTYLMLSHQILSNMYTQQPPQ